MHTLYSLQGALEGGAAEDDEAYVPANEHFPQIWRECSSSSAGIQGSAVAEVNNTVDKVDDSHWLALPDARPQETMKEVDLCDTSAFTHPCTHANTCRSMHA